MKKLLICLTVLSFLVAVFAPTYSEARENRAHKIKGDPQKGYTKRINNN